MCRTLESPKEPEQTACKRPQKYTGKFIYLPFPNNLFRVGILISHHLKVDGLPWCWQYPWWWSSLPPPYSAPPLHSAQCIPQQAGKWQDMGIQTHLLLCGSAPGWPHRVSLLRCPHGNIGEVSGLFPVPLRLVIFISFLSNGWKTFISSPQFGLCCWKRDEGKRVDDQLPRHEDRKVTSK